MSVGSKRAFIEWFKKQDPFAFRVALEAAKLRESGLGNPEGSSGVSVSSIFSSIVDTAKNLLPVYGQYRMQSKILNTQIKRAEQGLPPIDAAEITPTIRVQAELSPEQELRAKEQAIQVVKGGISSMKPIFFGALALGAFFLMKRR